MTHPRIDASSQVVAERLAAVRRRIAAACERAGRSADQVRLVAVTKTVSASVAAILPTLGIPDLGESRVQEGARKKAAIANEDHPSIRWHLIGSLQTNKVRRAVETFDVVHSVDRPSLIDCLALEAERANRRIPILLQINVAKEDSKHGAPPEQLPDLLQQARRATPLLDVRGLMTMAPFADNPEDARPHFRLLRQMRDRHLPPDAELSMGMTADFEVAVEEGATMVRIGTALFPEGL